MLLSKLSLTSGEHEAAANLIAAVGGHDRHDQWERQERCLAGSRSVADRVACCCDGLDKNDPKKALEVF